MSNNPKVSIILPVYNVRKYINQALDSLVNQTLKELEFICIDDCSTDGCLDVLEEYAKKDKRFVILKQETNQGQGIARNRGLDIAKGDYIMFLDPDDWYELDACEKAYNQIAKNGDDFIYFNLNHFYEESNVFRIDKVRLSYFKEFFDRKSFSFDEVKQPFMQFGESFYKIYNKNYLLKNKIYFDENRCFEDIFFYTKCILNARTVSVLNEPLYCYRHNRFSTIENKNNFLLIFDIRNRVLNYVLNFKNKERFIDFYVVAHVKSLMGFYKRINYKNLKLKKDYYIKMQNALINLNKRFDIREIKQYIKYKTFKRYIKNNWNIELLIILIATLIRFISFSKIKIN